MAQPKLYIIAGPNGAGETTFADKFLPRYTDCKQFVNADVIAKGLAFFSPESAALRTGRHLLGQIFLGRFDCMQIRRKTLVLKPHYPA